MDAVQLNPPTPRQLELLVLHAEGMTFDEIGSAVHLSPFTVKFHLDELRRRTQAKNLTQAAIVCVAAGYLCVDGRARRPFVPTSLEAAA